MRPTLRGRPDAKGFTAGSFMPLQRAQTPQLARRPITDQSCPQRPEAGQLERGLGAGERLGEPGGEACRPEGDAVDDGVPRRAVGDPLALSLEDVLVAEACAADVDAPRVDPDAVVEEDRLEVPHVRLGRQRLVT